MNPTNSRKELYNSRRESFMQLTLNYGKQLRNSNIMRGVSFIGGAAAAIVAANYSLPAMYTAIAVSLAAFIYFIHKSRQFQNLHQYCQTMQYINENEAKSLEGNNSAFDGGQIYISKSHNFSYDLDIFGENSIFQKVNRTATQGGSRMLAHKLQNPSTSIEEILEIQHDAQPYQNEIDIRQDFLAYGKILYVASDAADPMNTGSLPEPYFTRNPAWLIIAILLSISTTTAIALSCLGIISPYPALMLYGIQMAVYSLAGQHTNTLKQCVFKKSRIYGKYGKLFNIIARLKQKPQRFENVCYKGIDSALQELSQTAAMYEQRSNLMITIFGQGILCYDIFLNIKLERWIKKYGAEASGWFNVIHYYDFLFSLATLGFNNPDYHYPTPVKDRFVLEAQRAGHPLIPSDKCVRNNIQFSNCKYLTILTGANMAGKSTYLRTIGINLILAQIGAPVCAEEFRFCPTEIITSIRTNDSVQDNESYFFAELKRLSKIVERLQNGDTLFIIVDEMLRGTNSKDKHDGSKMFIEKLLKYNCYGIFATHDIDIGNMRNTYPENVGAKCFEIAFEGENLIFDYTLKDGISQNLNASYLMRKMGIIE